MGEKVCLFSRVSTTIQDLTSQENALIQAAKSDGYTDDQFIIISEHESGVKNSIKDRIGITKAIDAVLNHNVKVIYCFELSRVARRLDVFYEFRTFLIEHKVQLIILQPSVKLLNDKGEIDENFSLVFSIFASLAEQEARLMKTRLKRGKDERRSVNKFCDGVPCFGYIRTKESNLIVNEEEAEIVKHIFYEYNSGKTVEDIAKSLILNEVVKDKTISQAKGFCFHILHNCVYCGRATTENTYQNKHVKHGYYYPAIISEEDFDKADATFQHRQFSTKVHSKHVWLCRGILVNESGDPYHVHNHNQNYYTLLNKNDYGKVRTVPKKVVDDFIWSKVLELMMSKPAASVDVRRKELESKVKEIELQISDNEVQITETENKIKKIEYRIINGKLNEELGDEMKANFTRELDRFTKENVVLKANMDTLKRKISTLSDADLKFDMDEINSYTEEEKAKLIKEEVKQIVAVKSEVGRVNLGILFNVCNDPEFHTVVYREYKPRA